MGACCSSDIEHDKHNKHGNRSKIEKFPGSSSQPLNINRHDHFSTIAKIISEIYKSKEFENIKNLLSKKQSPTEKDWKALYDSVKLTRKSGFDLSGLEESFKSAKEAYEAHNYDALVDNPSEFLGDDRNIKMLSEAIETIRHASTELFGAQKSLKNMIDRNFWPNYLMREFGEFLMRSKDIDLTKLEKNTDNSKNIKIVTKLINNSHVLDIVSQIGQFMSDFSQANIDKDINDLDCLKKLTDNTSAFANQIENELQKSNEEKKDPIQNEIEIK
jgi:hypothetical protein